MAGEDKQHDATSSKLQKAKREGNVARSSELTALAAFVAGLGATCAALPLFGDAAAGVLRRPLDDARYAPLALAAFAPAAAAAAAAIGATLLQGGGLRLVALKLEPKKLDPVAGLKRMAGAEGIVAALKATLGLAVATAVVLAGAPALVATAVASGGPLFAAQAAWTAALHAAFGVIAVGLVMAGADYAVARRRWLRGLRMSHDEVRRDAKENDGDPHVRAQRRRLHRSLAGASVEKTREASFVVVNPTHIAIALRYAPPAVPVPQILVRAADDAALRVKTIAAECGIPLVENVPLARLLFRIGEAGDAIPAETYVAVAEVVAALTREGVLA